ncbi:DUF4238 domain-containing protein [Xanthomonas citri]|uniref:DUF4238 domain-containing protein n=1 Tax=Xanthomonas citri TaxID=346 RepID=UPI000C69770D|nr:DUF4238 domain-containing protein [Xanthomonas citri]SOO14214.1 hypothetical protein XFF7766_280078 [Xanthomonas citri pv. fuscans]
MATANEYDPLETRNQHYLPQFWQRRFDAGNKEVWTLQDNRTKKIGPKKLMSQDWLYTIYDAGGRPSNALERAAGYFETKAAKAFSNLDTPGAVGSVEDQIFLRWFVAFSACRHPDTLNMGHRRSKELTVALVDAFNQSLSDYQVSLSKLGVGPEEAAWAYDLIRKRDEETSLEEMDDVLTRSPNDAILPSQIALHPETIERVFFQLARYSVEILDAPVRTAFVLGDTPFPPNLSLGFTLPISSGLALRWSPANGEMLPDWKRRLATPTEVAETNRVQADNAARVLIAQTEADLLPFVSCPNLGI